MPGPVLYVFAAIPFEVYPLNIHEMQHVTGTDWARKEIAGAAIHREWVGENDEEIHLRGRVFPHFFVDFARRSAPRDPDIRKGAGGRWGGVSGLGHLDVLDNMRRLGQAHVLMRGDGWHYGWFVIERMMRGHTFLGQDGVGQKIEFEATFQRVPAPLDPSGYFSSFWMGTGQ